MDAGAEHPVVLFDGVCKFCNAGVNFLIDRDPGARFRFAALQSARGQELLRRFHRRTDDFDTFLLVEGERCWARSTAALRIAVLLGGCWRLLFPLLLVPPFLRDAVYDLVARHRYRWFGRLDSCRMPTADLKRRFLD